MNSAEEELTKHIIRDEEMFKMLNTKIDSLTVTVRKWGLLGGFFGGIAGAGVHLLGGCASLPNRPTDIDLASYSQRLANCIANNDTKASIDSCREKQRRAFCFQWPTEINCSFDAGNSEESAQ